MRLFRMSPSHFRALAGIVLLGSAIALALAFSESRLRAVLIPRAGAQPVVARTPPPGVVKLREKAAALPDTEGVSARDKLVAAALDLPVTSGTYDQHNPLHRFIVDWVEGFGSASVGSAQPNAPLFVASTPPTTPARIADELPIALGPDPQLFIDDFLIAWSHGVTRTTHAPRRADAPAITAYPGVSGSVNAPSIVYDPNLGLFRMWHWTPLSDEIVGTRMIYRESSDGLNWGPGRYLLEFNGYGNAVVDSGPHAPDPARRFKLAYFLLSPVWDSGMYLAFSPDGLDWEFHDGPPVFRDLRLDAPWGDPRRAQAVSDIIDPYWDPIRQRFGAFLKMFPTSFLEFGLQSRTMPEADGTRLTGQTSSDDFLSWEPPWRAFVPREGDEGVTEFYGATVLARGDLLIAFLRILRDDLPADPGEPEEGIGYTVLATSRDGRHWQRFDDVFLGRNPAPGTYDHAMAWIYGAAAHQDHVYLAYSAYAEGHKVGRRTIGMATLPLDRFVSRGATGEREGLLRTRLLVSRDGRSDGLWLNADAASGVVRVQVRDRDDDVVPGFSFDDCRPVTGDGLALEVRCARGFRELGEAALRLEFSLRNARLFGFSLSEPDPKLTAACPPGQEAKEGAAPSCRALRQPMTTPGPGAAARPR